MLSLPIIFPSDIMKHLFYVIILSFLPLFSYAKSETEKVPLPSQELNDLDQVLKNAIKYDRAKKLQIDSLQNLLKKTPENDYTRKWQLAISIGNQFKVFSADSALKYYQQGQRIAELMKNDSLVMQSRILSINALAAAGIFTKAEKELNEIEKIPMSRNLNIELLKAGRQLYSYILSYIDGHQEVCSEYKHRYDEYDDKLIALLPKTSTYYRFIYAERLINEGRYKEAKQILMTLMDELPDYSNLYGMAAYQMAEAFKNQGDENQYATYLAKSAMSDIKGSVKEGLALPTLAKWLYEQGDVNRAYQYINSSLEDAMTGNARMRTVTIARFVPLIDDAYRQKINSSRDELMVYFSLVSFLLVISGVLMFFLMRQVKRIREAQKKLAATSKVQESYIGNFLGLCSSYADKLESMSKLVSRKISAGQTDELMKLIKSGKFAEDQNDDFYKIFDTAFLDLYPDFVVEVNKLLREEEQIFIKKGQGLPTELRIYAFVRLGVEESTRISQILHYSVSTVYTYRNKMRNKAISRDTFEDDIMKIGRNYVD